MRDLRAGIRMEIKERSDSSLSLRIFDSPQVLPRPRMGYGRIFNPVSRFQQSVVSAFRLLLPLNTSFPLWSHEPLHASFKFWFPMPVSWTKKKKNLFALSPHIHLRDLDNIIKFYLDTFNRTMYGDDKQVYSLRALKQWAPLDNKGYVEMKIEVKEKGTC